MELAVSQILLIAILLFVGIAGLGLIALYGIHTIQAEKCMMLYNTTAILPSYC